MQIVNKEYQQRSFADGTYPTKSIYLAQLAQNPWAVHLSKKVAKQTWKAIFVGSLFVPI